MEWKVHMGITHQKVHLLQAAPGLLPHIFCFSLNIMEQQPLTAHHLSSFRCYMMKMPGLTPELAPQLQITELLFVFYRLQDCSPSPLWAGHRQLCVCQMSAAASGPAAQQSKIWISLPECCIYSFYTPFKLLKRNKISFVIQVYTAWMRKKTCSSSYLIVIIHWYLIIKSYLVKSAIYWK